MEWPVVIVGAGPTGLTAAALLARHGVECLVLERRESAYAQPRAVHLDDEVYRILVRMGLGEEFARISRPANGLRLVDRDMRVLAEFRRGQGRHGYPEANMFDQPELERLLRGAVAEVRWGVEVVGVVQRGDRVRVDLADGEPVWARYVLGCDGANSVVRTSRMVDLGFAQRWLVVDVVAEGALGLWEGVHQVCDRERAGTYLRVGECRHRWEFRLRPGESAEQFRDMAALRPLIAPWTTEDVEPVRVAEYTFRAQIARQWRVGNVFLLGDAAHLTPPFIGQGLGSGLRDASNLAWKLGLVLSGSLPESILDSYQAERLPHVRTLIRLAKVVGYAMTGGGEAANLVRRWVIPRLRLVPGLRARVLSSETPGLRSELTGLAGRLVPNAVLADGRRFDEVVGERFAVVSTSGVEGRLGAVEIVARPGEELYDWLRRHRVRTAVVRPDGTVLAAGRDPAAAWAPLTRLVG